MFIAVNHDINDPASFWASAQASLPNLPAGIFIHQVMPNDTMDKAVCIWQADSIAHLSEYLEGKTSQFCKNTYQAVNETNAMGLPKAMVAA